ncbi:uncharacterized protein [Nothobranchius furzeri]|uniref:uncharacterized protein isoform X1 n=1 Tax=Nothobranchius furzeri TaxID=105023 RepID=UPI003904AFD6
MKTRVSRSEVYSCCHSLSLEFSLCRWACLEVNQAAADLLISQPGVFKQLRDSYTSLDDYSTWVPSKPPRHRIFELLGPFEILDVYWILDLAFYPSCSRSPDQTSTFIPDWLFSGTPTCLSLSFSLARTTSSCPPKLPGSQQTQLPPRLPFWISVSGIPSQPRPDHSSLKLLSPLYRLFPAPAPFMKELSYVQAAGVCAACAPIESVCVCARARGTAP